MDEFDLDLDEVSMANAAYKQEPRSLDRRICICGHAMSRHHFNDYTGGHYCKPGQLSCPCATPRPVIEVPNTRYFMRKSHGSGAKHALPRGIVASMEALGEEEFTSKRVWLIEQKCDVCKQETKLYPVRVSQDGHYLTDDKEDQGLTYFWCAECRAA